jgi:hypothetical protein
MKDSMKNQTTEVSIAAGQGLVAYYIKQEGNLPLRFKGKIIGSAKKEDRNANDSYHRVTIYYTAAGKFVVEEVFDANHLDRPSRHAAAFAEAKDVVAWLRNTEDKQLSDVAVRALGDAAMNDEQVEAAFGEDVD